VHQVPFRSHGAYRGREPLAGLSTSRPPDGPIIVWTFANIPTRNLLRFYDGIARGTRKLLDADGLIVCHAGPERLFHGAATLTFWETSDHATAFAYREDPHKQIVKDVRDENLLIDSMFIRSMPYRAAGNWPARSRFAQRFETFKRSLPGSVEALDIAQAVDA
jgi:hypothetical protein